MPFVPFCTFPVRGGQDTSILHAVIKLIWNFSSQGWWGHKTLVLSTVCTHCALPFVPSISVLPSHIAFVPFVPILHILCTQPLHPTFASSLHTLPLPWCICAQSLCPLPPAFLSCLSTLCAQPIHPVFVPSLCSLSLHPSHPVFMLCFYAQPLHPSSTTILWAIIWYHHLAPLGHYLAPLSSTFVSSLHILHSCPLH